MWISLAIETDNAHAEVLSDALLELGALSTDLHDAAAGTEREQPLFDEPGEAPGEIWPASELTALFEARCGYTFHCAGCGGSSSACQSAELPYYPGGRAGLGPAHSIPVRSDSHIVTFMDCSELASGTRSGCDQSDTRSRISFRYGQPSFHPTVPRLA